jgi:hypothetical protein
MNERMSKRINLVFISAWYCYFPFRTKEEKGSNTGNKHLGKVKCYRCHQMGRYVN